MVQPAAHFVKFLCRINICICTLPLLWICRCPGLGTSSGSACRAWTGRRDPGRGSPVLPPLRPPDPRAPPPQPERLHSCWKPDARTLYCGPRALPSSAFPRSHKQPRARLACPLTTGNRTGDRPQRQPRAGPVSSWCSSRPRSAQAIGWMMPLTEGQPEAGRWPQVSGSRRSAHPALRPLIGLCWIGKRPEMESCVPCTLPSSSSLIWTRGIRQ